MKTTAVALECKVTVNTIRNWTRDYTDFLSEGAKSTSSDREFTGRDLDVLKYIALLRSEGLQRASIVQRLSETTFSEIDDQPSDQHIKSPSPEASTDDHVTSVTESYSLSTVNINRDAIIRLFTRVDGLEKLAENNRQNRMTDVILGVLLALGFMVVILLLALLYGR